MFRQFWIWLPIGIGLVAIAAFVWLILNNQGYKARGRRRSERAASSTRSQRRSDVRVLSAQERRLFKTAQKLLAEGKILPAATILEQLNMPREAIKTLEDNGLIHEAAKILMRMGRHNRAGVVYARNDMWEHAAHCFKVAGMPVEAANAARQSGDLKAAAELFEKGARYDLAADCCERHCEYQRAARLYLHAGMRDRAMRCYDQLAKTSTNIALIELEAEELRTIVTHLSEGNFDPGLADLAASRNRLPEIILKLLGKGQRKQASVLFRRASSDIAPLLMAEVNYQDLSAENLALMFLDVAAFVYAGMIYERMNSFDKASEAFEKGEDFERSAYCAERAGQAKRASLLKEKARSTPQPEARAASGKSTNFALASVQDESRRNPNQGGLVPLDIKPIREPLLGAAGAVATPTMPPRPPRPVKKEGSFSLREVDDTKSDQNAPPFPDEADDEIEDEDDSSEDDSSDADAALRARFDAEGSEEHTKVLAIIPPKEALSGPDGSAAESHTPPSPASHVATRPSAPAAVDTRPEAASADLAMFHRAKFLSDLDPDQRVRLWEIGSLKVFKKGETLLTYNDEPRGIYIIIGGEISVYRIIAGHETYIDEMGESDCFGELWLLADQPTAVRFVAAKDAKVLIIERTPFNELLDKDGAIARKLYKRFTMRLLKRLLKPQTSRKNQQAS